MNSKEHSRSTSLNTPQAFELLRLAPGWSRRSFLQTVGGASLSGGIFASLSQHARGQEHLAAGEATDPSTGSPVTGAYRAVSWWLVFDDLTWPNQGLKDKIRRRADRCAENGVNSCVVFGTHFRWDFMPIWGRVHGLLRYIRDELHERGIALLDHHSSVLTHRPVDEKEALNIWQKNRHHVPFYPSRETAATWTFNGTRMNDWRVIDVETGSPVYLPAYNAEQYCMNNPDFREAYALYVQKLVEETGIDGLMSDDGIYYAFWHGCGCKHCRERFRSEYGHSLPPTSDTAFWGNRQNVAFRDWIEMRYRTCGDFLDRVREALPEGFPLMTCCSSSETHVANATGMSYQDFISSCDMIMLEMVGSTPSVRGTWDDRTSSQMLHLGIARDNQIPCLGLGYGYRADTAFFIWALNKFLGSDSWFSTLKGRLNATEEELETLPDDSEIVGEGYKWERDRPRLFNGRVDTDIAVHFSRPTRDYYGQIAQDYALDFQNSCLQLMRQGLTYDVVTEAPGSNRWNRLVIGSAACLSREERGKLEAYMRSGGTVIATGPMGDYDGRGEPAAVPWLRGFGITYKLLERAVAGGFPPMLKMPAPVEVARCKLSEDTAQKLVNGWIEVPFGKGRLFWRPERVSDRGIADAVVSLLKSESEAHPVVKNLPANWRQRRFRDGDRWLIHAIPAKIDVVFHPSLKNQINQERVIDALKYTALASELTVESQVPLKKVTLHSPDLSRPRDGQMNDHGPVWSVDTSEVRRYFIIECS